MTGLRAARINAGYATAREAHAAFAKGKKGREALSFAYWQKLEATGPKYMNLVLLKRLSQFLGCSANLVFAHTAEPTYSHSTTPHMKGTSTPAALRQPTRSLAGGRARQQKGPAGNPLGPEKATTTTPTTTTPEAPKTPRTRGARKPLITATDALPGVTVLPIGIREADPAKALPLVIERLNATQKEMSAAKTQIAGLEKSLAAYKSSEATAVEAFGIVQKERDELRLKVVALDTANKWRSTETEKIQEAKENLWNDYRALQSERDGLKYEVAQIAQDLRLAKDTNAGYARLGNDLRALWGTFDKDKPVSPATSLLPLVSELFLERNNARMAAETAQNNVSRLKAEEARLATILGGIYSRVKDFAPETAQFSDVPAAIDSLAESKEALSGEVDTLTDEVSEWRGRFYGALAMTVLGSLYAVLHTIGVVK